jgi:hypothetical protein
MLSEVHVIQLFYEYVVCAQLTVTKRRGFLPSKQPNCMGHAHSLLSTYTVIELKADAWAEQDSSYPCCALVLVLPPEPVSSNIVCGLCSSANRFCMHVCNLLVALRVSLTSVLHSVGLYELPRANSSYS